MFFFGMIVGFIFTVAFEVAVIWAVWDNRKQISAWVKANL